MVKAEAEQQTTEAQLERALKSRIQHFRDNASSLNLVSIRRLLEEDLGLEKHALDVHKSFVKQFIDKNLHADVDNDSKKTSGIVRKEINSTVKKDKDLSGASHGDEVKREEDSPIMGVLTTKTELATSQGIEISEDMIKKAIQERADYIRSQSETLTLAKARRYLEEELKLSKDDLDPFKKFIHQEIEAVIESGVVSTSAMVTKKGSSGNCQNKTEETVEKDKDLSGLSHRDEAKMEEDSSIMGILTTKTELARSQRIEISEDMIKKAIQERADYIRSQSETLTLAKARQYLEEELKLGKNALDPFKKFIRQEIEAVIDSGGVSTPAMVTKKGSSRNRQSKTEEGTSEGSSDSMDSENVAEDHKAKPREKPIQRGEAKKLKGEKKRKIPEKKTDVSGKKQRMLANKQSKENSDADNDGGVSEDGETQSSVEKPAKKKEAPTPTFGKHVEQLKSVIKACGMSIAPTVYKKAKQVPDSKRETFLIKELEGILSKEGLSKNPSEKEIKEVRKRKERAKELEGIDMSNIITSSRRRSTMSFVPPPRPKKKDESGDDAMTTKKDKDDNKDAKKKEKKSDSKDAKKKKEDGSKDASKKEEDDDGEDAKKKEKDVDDDEEEKEEKEEEEEEEDEEEQEEEEEEEDDSQSEEFNDDDEDSD